MKYLLALLTPLVLALLSLTIWNRWPHPDWLLIQAWNGVLIVFGLAFAAGIFTQPTLQPAGMLLAQTDDIRRQHPWLIWTQMACWTVTWIFFWLALPMGSMYRLIVPPIFFLLAWLHLRTTCPSDTAARRSVAVTLTALAASFGVVVLMSHWRLERLLSNWTGPLDATGIHFEYVQILKLWMKLSLWGPSNQSLASMQLHPSGKELLESMVSYGSLPGVFVGVALMLGWYAAWSWLRRTVPAPGYSLAARRLGLAIMAVQGLVAVIYLLFNFGLLRYPYSMGLFPFAPHAAGWLQGAVLVWIIFAAVRFSDKSTQDTAGRKHWWITLLGYTMVSAALSFAILICTEQLIKAHFNTLIAGLSRAHNNSVV